jgi:ceramide glucosyltransferase
MWVFYLFAALLLLQSLLSLRGGFRYLSYFRRELARTPAPFAPRATVFVPCRGVERGLRENLSALFRQDYPAFEIVFVSDSADDPALRLARELIELHARDPRAGPRDELNTEPRADSHHEPRAASPGDVGADSRVGVRADSPADAGRGARGEVWARALAAGRAVGRGQKVHNLRAAVREAGAESEVYVFFDTDARPRTRWLRSLVAPLSDSRVGAATGYRWFVAERGGLASRLRAVWNASIASALGENGAGNFCWGGSTAIRRETFERLDVLGRWRGALSDDYALTRALQGARLPVKFVPACLVASHGDCTAAELLEFTTRQLKITRVYAPRLWRIVLVSNLLFASVFFGGLGVAAARAAAGRGYAATLALVAALYALGSCKAALRLRAVSLALAPEDERAGVRGGLRPGAREWAAQLLLWPVASLLFAWNASAAGLSRRIRWRGIDYEMRSPTETLVLGRDAGGPEAEGPEDERRAVS